MGAGIALVALSAGCTVHVYDVQPSVLDGAKTEIERRTSRRVEKGEWTQAQARVQLERLTLSSDMSHLSTADLVVEAAPERMDLKQTVFRELDDVCQPDAILATNTSSLSVTEIAAATRHPARVVGMHFFNPAPVMRLVEVVVGEQTSPATVAAVVAFARAFGKQPAVCTDTPGFIVNRVARNFYGEALRVVGEGTACVQDVDCLLHGNAGFPLGPFTLMDFIGVDVNLDVTQSVYQAFFGEPRYRPHLLQARRVATGQFGRKSGQGFYSYGSGRVKSPVAQKTDADLSFAPVGAVVETVDLTLSVVIGDTPLAAALLGRLAAESGRSAASAGLVFDQPLFAWDATGVAARAQQAAAFVADSAPTLVWTDFSCEQDAARPLLQAIDAALPETALLLVSLAGPSATEQASWLQHPQRVRGFCSVLPLPAANPILLDAGGDGTAADRATVAWSRPLQAGDKAFDRRAQAALTALCWDPVEVRDGAGGVVMRVLAMVLNEATEALREGIANAADLDTAMRLGTSYPLGPVAWLRTLGVASVWNTMNACWRELGDDRYRPSPLLRQWWLAGAIVLPETAEPGRN